MKTLYRISLFLNVVTLCALLVWLGSFMANKVKVEKKEPFEKKQMQDYEDLRANTVEPNKSEQNKFEQNKLSESNEFKILESDETKLVSHDDDIMTCDTVYFVSSYDIATSEERYQEEKLPQAYMGKNRQQLLELIEEYNKSPSLSDLEKGFIEMSLDTFSSQKVCVRKTYKSSFYFGCLVVEDGYLNVYDENRENVIIYTDILFDRLPEDIKQQILDGKYFKTEDELYNFLESYSS